MSFQLVSILKGAHLSVDSVLLFFMKGPYDDDLHCYNMAIKRKICFKLLNQISDYLNIVLMWLLPQIILLVESLTETKLILVEIFKVHFQ